MQGAIQTQSAGSAAAAELEEGDALLLDWGKLSSVAANGGSGVVPVVVQDAGNGRVIMLGYVNAEALAEAQRLRRAVFWSTSRNELWIKGAGSGDALELLEVRINCEQNSLLYLVKPLGGGACHTRGADGRTRPGCYYRRVVGDRLEPAGPAPAWESGRTA